MKEEEQGEGDRGRREKGTGKRRRRRRRRKKRRRKRRKKRKRKKLHWAIENVKGSIIHVIRVLKIEKQVDVLEERQENILINSGWNVSLSDEHYKPYLRNSMSLKHTKYKEKHKKTNHKQITTI